MRKELDMEGSFAKWGKPGEELDDEWYETFPETIREEGQLVAKHEWCGRYAGENVVRLFRGTYISEDEADICGPYETFKEAADAVNFFHVTTATTKIWVDPEILSTLELPSTLFASSTTSVSSSETQTLPPQENKSTPQLNEHEKAWERELEALNARLIASGLTFREKAPPLGSAPLVATFHNPSARKQKSVKALPKQKLGNSVELNIDRRSFLRSLTAAGAVIALPVSLAQASQAMIDQAWNELLKDPWSFEVEESGALIDGGMIAPKTNADLYDTISDNITTQEQLIDEIAQFEGVQEHFNSLLRKEIEDLEDAVDENNEFRLRIENEEVSDLESKKYDADEAQRLENRLRNLETLDSSEGWEEWIRIEGDQKFSRFKEMMGKFLSSEVNWGAMDIWPVNWGSQGRALAFFDSIDHDIVKSIGVVLVEGQHPGSSYYAAELRNSIEDANKAAQELGLPFRFRKERTHEATA